MSGPEASNGRDGEPPGESVLASLPRSRPQRSSPRRAAARKATSANGAVTVAVPADSSPKQAKVKRASGGTSPARARRAKAAGAPSTRPAARATSRPASGERVPRQGFECDSEGIRGPVQPPGGAELVASALEIVGELAKSGLASGERLLKDVFSRISPS
jgi:hypothetical protein